MIRSTVAHVDLDALQANFKAIQEFLAIGSAGRDGPPRTPPTIIARPSIRQKGEERAGL